MGNTTLLRAAVLAVLALGGAAYSVQSAPSGPVPAPANLTATVVSVAGIDLSWTGSLSTGTYRIERSRDGSAFAEIDSTQAGVTNYSDSGLLDDTSYVYRVRARKGSGYSAYSNEASASTPSLNSWRTLGGNPRHSGQNDLEPGVPPLTAAWTADLNPPNVFASIQPVVVEGGKIYASVNGNFANLPSKLWAINRATGQIVWSHDFGLVAIGAPAVRHGRVFIPRIPIGPGESRYLDSLDASTGALLWSVAFGAADDSYSVPLPVGNTVYLEKGSNTGGGGIGGIGGIGGGIGGGGGGGLYPGYLQAFNASTGQQLFSNAVLESAGGSPAYDGGYLYTHAMGMVRRHDAATGATLWTVSAGVGTLFSTPVVGGGRVFVAAPGMVQAVNIATQAVDWTLTGYTISWSIPPAYADGVLYAVNAGTILAIDAATGKPVWSFTDDFRIEFSPVVANNHLFVSSRNELHGINLGTREVVFKEINTWGGPLAIAEGKLLVARVDGLLKAYTLSPGSLPDQAVPPAAPQSLTVQAAGTGSAQLAWTDVSSSETGFRLERSTDGTNFSLRTEFGAGATSFLDTGLVHPTAYTYRVKAFNAAGSSAASNMAQVTPPAPGNAWLMLGNNPQHTGVNPNETGKPPVTELWTWAGGTQSLSPVVTEDGRVFTSSNSALVALEGATGGLLWTHGFNGGYAAGPPAVQNGRVFYQYINGSSDSKIFCLNAATGRVVWGSSFYTQSSLFPAPVMADGRVFITAWIYNTVLDAYDADDGRQLWGNSGGYIPAIQSGTVYTHYGDQFRALDPATGNALWSTPLLVGSTPTLSATRGYGTTNRDLYSLNLATRAVEKVIPSGNLNNYYTEPSIAGGVVYWVTDGVLQARRESDLRLQWSFAGDGTIRTRPVIANGHVYVSSTQNTYVLSVLRGKLAATIPAGGAVSVASGRLYIAGLDGTLRAYRLSP